MKQIPLLQGKALLVELPEGTRDHQIITGYDKDGSFPSLAYNGRGFEPIRLPEGNWRIIGMLSEVREDQAKEVVDAPVNVGLLDLYLNYKEKSHSAFTALESLESAIRAEGLYLDSPPFKQTKFTNPDIWESVMPRVLSRERCILLKEVSTSP